MSISRVIQFESIFKRVTGLLKSGAISHAERPLWYDVYRAFPPAQDPSLSRPAPDINIPKLVYPEDLVRAEFYRRYGVAANAEPMNLFAFPSVAHILNSPSPLPNSSINSPPTPTHPRSSSTASSTSTSTPPAATSTTTHTPPEPQPALVPSLCDKFIAAFLAECRERHVALEAETETATETATATSSPSSTSTSTSAPNMKPMKPLASLPLDEQEALWTAAIQRLEREGTRLTSPEELQQEELERITAEKQRRAERRATRLKLRQEEQQQLLLQQQAAAARAAKKTDGKSKPVKKVVRPAQTQTPKPSSTSK